MRPSPMYVWLLDMQTLLSPSNKPSMLFMLVEFRLWSSARLYRDDVLHSDMVPNIHISFKGIESPSNIHKDNFLPSSIQMMLFVIISARIIPHNFY